MDKNESFIDIDSDFFFLLVKSFKSGFTLQQMTSLMTTLKRLSPKGATYVLAHC